MYCRDNSRIHWQICTQKICGNYLRNQPPKLKQFFGKFLTEFCVLISELRLHGGNTYARKDSLILKHGIGRISTRKSTYAWTEPTHRRTQRPVQENSILKPPNMILDILIAHNCVSSLQIDKHLTPSLLPPLQTAPASSTAKLRTQESSWTHLHLPKTLWHHLPTQNSTKQRRNRLKFGESRKDIHTIIILTIRGSGWPL